VTPSPIAAALRSTCRLALSAALAGALTVSVVITAFAANELIAQKVPVPKPRPMARNVGPKTTRAAAPAALPAVATAVAMAPKVTASIATAGPNATPPRLRAALPATTPRKPVTPAAVAATSSTSQGDKDALETVIELIRKHNSGEATQAEASITDPVARKLAEWIILRSEDNGASVERYRAFIEANPSWPSQSFLRRRLEAAMWDDKREDSVANPRCPARAAWRWRKR
jgi:soluble lytic murein transglycosylase